VKDREKAYGALTSPREPIGPSYGTVCPVLEDALPTWWLEMTATPAMLHAEDFLVGR